MDFPNYLFDFHFSAKTEEPYFRNAHLLTQTLQGLWHQLARERQNDELLLWYGGPTKGVYPYFQSGPLSEIFIISNLRYILSRIWTCAEPEFRLCWMELCSSGNHYNTAPPELHASVSSKRFSLFWSNDLSKKFMIYLIQ